MRVFILAAFAVMCAGTAVAQDEPLRRIYVCAALPDAGERLACYDAAVSGLKQAESAGDVTVVSREEIAEAQKKAFGLDENTALASAARPAGKSPPPADMDRIRVSITSVEKRANGRYRFLTADGQVWDQIETYRIPQMNPLPREAEIREASFGSYLLSVGEGRAVRVRRVK